MPILGALRFLRSLRPSGPWAEMTASRFAQPGAQPFVGSSPKAWASAPQPRYSVVNSLGIPWDPGAGEHLEPDAGYENSQQNSGVGGKSMS